MSDFFGTDLVDGFRDLDQSGMPNDATNSRTGLTTKCRISRQPTMLPMEVGLRVRAYRINFPYGTSVQAGDLVAVPDIGTTYAIQQTTSRISYATRVEMLGVPTDLLQAVPQAPERAVFYDPNEPGRSVEAWVYVMGRPSDVQTAGPSVAQYPWMAGFDDSLEYEDGFQIVADHRLSLASLFGSDSRGNARAGVISRPRPVLHALPFAVVYLKESA